jgi:hypothetical protein
MKMEHGSLTKFWPLIYSVVQEFWEITEPHIEDVAIREDIPVELYFCSELGFEYFSIEDFQKRDPFSNPEKFERLFARLNVKGWIAPAPDGRYQVTEQAREGVRRIIQAGDDHLMEFEPAGDFELERLVNILQRIVTANLMASEPPQKWSILNRFRVAAGDSPLIVRTREYLMDLFAYRDDAHLSAARPHFGQAGIVWSVLGSIWSGDAVIPEAMAETMPAHGYEVEDYEVAVKAAIEIGWVEASDVPGTFRLTQTGTVLREQVESLTDEYYYRPWSALTQDELDELYNLLTKLRDQLRAFRQTH